MDVFADFLQTIEAGFEALAQYGIHADQKMNGPAQQSGDALVSSAHDPSHFCGAVKVGENK